VYLNTATYGKFHNLAVAEVTSSSIAILYNADDVRHLALHVCRNSLCWII